MPSLEYPLFQDTVPNPLPGARHPIDTRINGRPSLADFLKPRTGKLLTFDLLKGVYGLLWLGEAGLENLAPKAFPFK